jgi:hypothetical protein
LLSDFLPFRCRAFDEIPDEILFEHIEHDMLSKDRKVVMFMNPLRNNHVSR